MCPLYDAGRNWRASRSTVAVELRRSSNQSLLRLGAQPMSAPAPSRISVLAFGAFGVGTSGYIVAGLLPALTGELHVSATAAAQLVTAFAIAYAIGSPACAPPTAA